MVEAHLTIGQGPGPVPPDFETASGAPLCAGLPIDVESGGRVVLGLDWGTGCLENKSSPVEPMPSPLLPDRPADVSGVLFSGAGEPPPFQLAVSRADDQYYDAALLDGLDEAVLIDGATGAELDRAKLVPGLRVEVWWRGVCRQSAPVQCDVEALRTRP